MSAGGSRTEQPVTILVVDNERAIAALLRRVLEEQGFTVLTAMSWDEAIWSCESCPGRIHLALVDVLLVPRHQWNEERAEQSKTSGVQLARRLTGIRPDMGVIFITSFSDCLNVLPEELPSNTLLISKPFQPSGLIDAVYLALARSRVKEPARLAG